MSFDIQTLAAVILLIGLAASFYGWGLALQRILRLAHPGAAASVALGVAVVLAAGGWLMLLRLAFAPALWGIAAAGWVLLVLNRGPARDAGAEPQSGRIDGRLAGALIVVALGFTAATQLPPGIFNHHDDLEKYFAHPVRMLATGALAGSPLNALGSETLGGAPFLHGFVLAVLPIPYINGVDAVLGLALLLCLVASLGRRLAPLPGATLAVACVLCIEPQYVNVSPLFLGAALIAACALLAARSPGGPPAVALGLLYAALVVLKPTFGFFAALHLPLTAASVAMERRSARTGFLWALRAGATAAAVLLPWVIPFVPTYLDVMPAEFLETVPPGPADPLRLFSLLGTAYGATFAHYTALALLGVAIALAAFAAAWRSAEPLERNQSAAALAIALAGAGACLFVVIVLGPSLYGRNHALRYVMPLLLGAMPAAMLLAPAAGPRRGLVAALGLVVITAAFAPTLAHRVRMAVEYRSILAFLKPGEVTARYALYTKASLGTTGSVRRLQAAIPPGEPLLAWVAQPYALDYARNPVYDVEAAGLAARWAQVPPAVRYVLWEPTGWRDGSEISQTLGGPGERARLGAMRTGALIGRLRADLEAGELLYRDERFLLFRRRSAEQ